MTLHKSRVGQDPEHSRPDEPEGIAKPSLDETTAESAIEARRSPATRRTPIMRLTMAAALLFTVWHLFCSFLWISPVTPLRELIPGNMLSSYMLPMFGQSWSVFAPDPINGDFSLKVRAVVVSADGKTQQTAWVDAAAVEVEGLHMHNPFPPRTSTAGIQQAAALKNAWEGLTSEQQAIVRNNYSDGRFWEERISYLLSQGADGGAGSNYVQVERRTVAYATQVARAIWGPSVQQVQFEVSRQNVVPFEDRHNPDAQRPARQIVSTGWRGTLELPGQSDRRFAEFFRPLYEAYEENHS